MIQIEGLTKIYNAGGGEVLALDNVSLQINRGEIFGIIGLSGAGKSTLIRCINMLEKPTSGTIRVDGQNISALDKKASVAKSYLAVTYECEIDSNKLQVKLATCNSDNGKNS